MTHTHTDIHFVKTSQFQVYIQQDNILPLSEILGEIKFTVLTSLFLSTYHPRGQMM